MRLKDEQALRELLQRPGMQKANPALARLPDPKRQPDKRGQSQDKQLDTSKEGMGYRVVIISIRKRLVDEHDNLRTGCKPLIDAITSSLGFAADDNPRLQWEYHQLIGKPTGTIVLIQAV